MHRRLLELMQCLCEAVQNMEDRTEGNFAEEGLRRQKEHQKLKKQRCA